MDAANSLQDKRTDTCSVKSGKSGGSCGDRRTSREEFLPLSPVVINIDLDAGFNDPNTIGASPKESSDDTYDADNDRKVLLQERDDRRSKKCEKEKEKSNEEAEKEEEKEEEEEDHDFPSAPLLTERPVLNGGFSHLHYHALQQPPPPYSTLSNSSDNNNDVAKSNGSISTIGNASSLQSSEEDLLDSGDDSFPHHYRTWSASYYMTHPGHGFYRKNFSPLQQGNTYHSRRKVYDPGSRRNVYEPGFKSRARELRRGRVSYFFITL
jgi:hypothetical protein